MIGNKPKNNSGFSLMEMLVAVGIFVLVITMVTSIFQNSIMIQRNAVATQNVQEGIRYAMEVISKEVRSAAPIIDSGGGECSYDTDGNGSDDLLTMTDADGANFKKMYNYYAADKLFFFRNRRNECVYYYLDTATNRLMIQRNENGGLGPVVNLPITPESIKVTNFDVAIAADDINAEFPVEQANVTFVLDIESAYEDMSNIKLQTSITSRSY